MARRKSSLKITLAVMQAQGLTRYEARRALYGQTRREATSHPTSGRMLLEQMAFNRARRRWRRRQQVAAAAWVGFLVEV